MENSIHKKNDGRIQQQIWFWLFVMLPQSPPVNIDNIITGNCVLSPDIALRILKTEPHFTSEGVCE